MENEDIFSIVRELRSDLNDADGFMRDAESSKPVGVQVINLTIAKQKLQRIATMLNILTDSLMFRTSTKEDSEDE